MTPALLPYPSIDPILVRIGPVAIRWYGIAYVAAFIAAWFVLSSLSKRWRLHLTEDDKLEILLAAVIGVIVGARLGYVLFYGLSGYLASPLSILAIWDGGMSFHGGLIGILVAGVVESRRLKVPFLTLCDIGAVAAPIGFFLGRIANFINGELYGRASNLPWAMVFPTDPTRTPRHPSQLYEAALEGIVLFAIMWWMSRRMRTRGTELGWLLVLYGTFRSLVELVRQPDVQIGFLPGGLTMGQLLSLPMIAVGIAVLVWVWRRPQGPQGPREVPAEDAGPAA